jgi:hypothetical protein
MMQVGVLSMNSVQHKYVMVVVCEGFFSHMHFIMSHHDF